MKIELLNGDSADWLKTLPENSIDSLVTDPPAGISFMGKTWDTPTGYGYSDGADRVAAPPTVNLGRNPTCQTCGGRKRAGPATKGCSCETPKWNDLELRVRDREAFIGQMLPIFEECHRVMKPGAHGLVWALPRTSHWTTTALEDAGFEIRDVVMHLFGTGFPKSLDVSKAIDKAAGADREVIGYDEDYARRNVNGKWGVGLSGDDNTQVRAAVKPITLPATVAAKKWEGWGTALKPAAEHWILVRKPLNGTVAANVLEFGTGAINIDVSRIGGAWENPSAGAGAGYEAHNTPDRKYGENLGGIVATPHPSGRFPANVVFTHHEDCKLIGTKKVKSDGPPKDEPYEVERTKDQRDGYGTGKGMSNTPTVHGFGDADGTETVEAWECVDGCPIKLLDEQSGVTSARKAAVQQHASTPNKSMRGGNQARVVSISADAGGGASRFYYCAKAPKRDKGVTNNHPTVKHTALMNYLITMITPPEGVVLDPFMGSGSTGVAALKAGFGFVGIEKDPGYFNIAQDRIQNRNLKP